MTILMQTKFEIDLQRRQQLKRMKQMAESLPSSTIRDETIRRIEIELLFLSFNSTPITDAVVMKREELELLLKKKDIATLNWKWRSTNLMAIHEFDGDTLIAKHTI